jgi:hypothetical protein
MDLLTMLGPIMAALFKLAPELIEDGQKLADALRSHPDASVQPGADHIERAINGVQSGQDNAAG